ncbi:hypothetical protein D3C77_500910 [compost metagenome]
MLLRIPDQGVAEEAGAQVAGEIGDAVRRVEAQGAVALEDVLHLHLPLGRELGEVGGDQLAPGRVRQLARHGHGPDGEGGDGFQRGHGAGGGGGLAGAAGGEREGGGQQGAA